MIENLAKTITELICRANAIDEEEKEIYTYGFFMLISKLAFFIVAIIFGAALDVIFESVVFYITFTILREYSGGIHAEKEIVCDICTTLAIGISVVFIKCILTANDLLAAYVIIILASIVIISMSPIQNDMKELSAADYLRYKKIICIIVAALVCITVISNILHIHGIIYAISTGMLLEMVLLILYKLLHI